ncbi:unnamed protein product [Cylindrotheca closterium]|uniref:Uncharacterized protein n=1 Tax=Cylindrotheca closterium TaxID=2856 RepID=A0AAD2CY11_9STRA|nr:unnamed protein product [Cylindrotheca closterium]
MADSSKSGLSKLKGISIKPSLAWCFVFFPALWYYGLTRLHSLGLFSSSSFGTAMETSLVGVFDCQKLKDASIVYYNHRNCEELSNNPAGVPLKYPLYLVRDDFRNVVATTWKHDEELGRGFLLISTSYGSGKIWQWETGGGPIPIGKTLSMIRSGCRSNIVKNCTTDPAVGSGGIVVDTLHEPPRLIVAEWGEGRIVRLEENGARTPLIIQIPVDQPNVAVSAEVVESDENEESTHTEMETESSPSTRRLERPYKLLLTPFADLLVLDNDSSNNSDGDDFLWHLPQIHKIPGLESLPASRKAHAWDRLNYNSSNHHKKGITMGTVSTSSHGATTTAPTSAPEDDGMPQKILQSSQLGGMALVPKNWLQIYVTMKQGDSVVVITLALDEEDGEDENDDDDDVVAEQQTKATSKSERQSSIYLDYSQHASKPGPIEVDEEGNLYLVVDDGILMVSPTGGILGKISIPDLSFVDMTLGEDRFLYLTTETKLYRLRVQNKNLSVPTDMVKQK